MTSSNQRRLSRLVRSALVRWPDAAARLDSGSQMEIARAAESDAERLILLGAYLSALANGAAHNTAQKRAARAVAKVRRAMGYAYPKQGLAGVSW